MLGATEVVCPAGAAAGAEIDFEPRRPAAALSRVEMTLSLWACLRARRLPGRSWVCSVGPGAGSIVKQ
jgi:hypothetical protein